MVTTRPPKTIVKPTALGPVAGPRRRVWAMEPPSMNLARVRQEIVAAQRYFDYVEGHPTVEGGVMALIALETSRHVYTLAVSFPESYPNAMPEVHVRRPRCIHRCTCTRTTESASYIRTCGTQDGTT